MQLWGLTDPGNLREQNQDSYAMLSFARDRSLMIVCDGMGGAKSGNVASTLAVDVFADEVRRCQKAGLSPERAAEILRGALELANKAVYEQAQLSDDFTGMGAHVNMIPLNDVKETGLHTSSREAIARFQSILQSHGITATVRRTLGSDIDASCGQLRRKFEKNDHKGAADSAD